MVRSGSGSILWPEITPRLTNHSRSAVGQPLDGYNMQMTEKIIAELFHEWNQALQTRDPKQVAALYDRNGILLPTMSDQVRHNREEIEDYFAHFLAKGPTGKIDESNIRSFGETAINSGVYTFTFREGAAVRARFTFVYRWSGKQWIIVEHHSSAMPE